MKINKNKWIFAGLILAVILFIASYAIYLNGEDRQSQTLTGPELPEIKEPSKSFDNRLEAVDAIEQPRRVDLPHMYEQTKMDSSGYSHPDLEGISRANSIDSIYQSKLYQTAYDTYTKTSQETLPGDLDSTEAKGRKQSVTTEKQLLKKHSQFYTVPKLFWQDHSLAKTDPYIYVVVHGKQTVQNKDRIILRLQKPATIRGRRLDQHTLIYGFVTLKKNRAQLEVDFIDYQPAHLMSFDMLDGNQGIYIKNSLQAQVSAQSVDQVLQEVNIPSLPQLGGLKNVFRKDNRKIKNTIYHNHQLVLKPIQPSK
ncbi:conjugative transposon protein TraM [Zhouia spongiae]|uniref:Conjugative transposon protein TraM n=1 Tax=Zhouia spongiae TaxID=2202721 RepID=A0ABY3YMD8_9FLAO|nr:conjugative transposon protein TraM [Zhouia spongiae]UNY98328.1 conjugative transposon protein TraM [Zhouia spongiae]